MTNLLMILTTQEKAKKSPLIKVVSVDQEKDRVRSSSDTQTHPMDKGVTAL